MSSGEGYSASEGGSRKRLKVSRTDSRPVPTSMDMTATADVKPIVVSSDVPVKAESSTSPHDARVNGEQNASFPHDGPCHHETSLRTLHISLDAMRQLITCKICQHFLYEPYALTCGHTFCYSCLLQWMGKNEKKTCPDCRSVIQEEPAPSYLVRDMVSLFGSRSELLADGETAEEHTQQAQEEADLVANDKANKDVKNGGLFKGRFKKGSRYMPLTAIRDYSDNVDRCPQCASEVEDGWCNACDVRVIGEDDDFSFSEDSDDDMDEELDADLDDAELEEDMNLVYDGSSDFGDVYPHQMGMGDHYPPVGAFGPYGIDFDSGSGEDSEDDDDLEGFVDDEVRHEEDGDDGLSDSDGTAVVAAGPPQRRQGPIVLSDSDDEEVAPVRARRRIVPRVSEEASTGGASRQSDSDSEDDEPIVTNSQRSRIRSRPITIESDEEEDESADEAGPTDDDESRVNLAAHYAIHGFSPQSYGSDDEEVQAYEQPAGHPGIHQYGYELDGDNRSDAPSGVSGSATSELDDDDDDDGDGDEEEDESDEDQSTAAGYESD